MVVHAEDGDLRRVEDRRAQQRAEDAAVGDGERAALEVLDGDLAVAGGFAESPISFSISAKPIRSASRSTGTISPARC